MPGLLLWSPESSVENMPPSARLQELVIQWKMTLKLFLLWGISDLFEATSAKEVPFYKDFSFFLLDENLVRKIHL